MCFPLRPQSQSSHGRLTFDCVVPQQLKMAANCPTRSSKGSLHDASAKRKQNSHDSP